MKLPGQNLTLDGAWRYLRLGRALFDGEQIAHPLRLFELEGNWVEQCPTRTFMGCR
jgi:hypothetical protein